MYIKKQQEDRQREMLDSYLAKRVLEVEKEYMETESYQRLSAQEMKLYYQLEDRLKGELKVLFKEYVDILFSVIIEEQEYFFRRGLMEFDKAHQYFSEVQYCP